MLRSCTLFLGLVSIALGATAAHGQTILEQLEKKVRDRLELDSAPSAVPAPPAAVAEAGSGQTDPAVKGGTEAELPAPNRKSPPPDPRPQTSSRSQAGGGATTSILEAPNLPPADPLPSGTDDSQAIYLGLEAESLAGGGIGARITGVTANSPAWRGGFKVNDVILAIDGYAITNLDTMVDRLSLRRPGDAIKVLVLRNGRNIDLTAVLQNASLARRVQGIDNSPLPSPLSTGGQASMGVSVADLSSAFRAQFGLRAFRAAAITNVVKGSPADLAGIQPGDAIVGVDNRPIESARDLLDWMQTKRPGDLVHVNVMRGARANVSELTLAGDPKFTPAPPNRSPQVGSLNEQNVIPNEPAPAETAFQTIPLENTIPGPVFSDNPGPVSDSSEVQQLRSELRAAREQLTSLEQRVIELESLLSKQPK